MEDHAAAEGWSRRVGWAVAGLAVSMAALAGLFAVVAWRVMPVAG